MNCISGSTILTCLFFCSACNAPASETQASSGSSDYSVHYQITPEPDAGIVVVEMSVEQTRGQIRELSFDLVDGLTVGVEADAGLTLTDDMLRWSPGAKGGTLRWRRAISHQRGDGGYDALLNGEWGIFRAEDIIPRARSRTRVNSKSNTTIAFSLPANWSAVSEYSTLQNRIEVRKPDRRFDQPSGWIAMGKLGVRRETIAGTRIAVVGPEDQSVRRMDMLALLNWILPELNAVLPDSLPRLTIISAGDPMWRGGLSAPGSIFIHADRPLISENATSTLAHEVFHVALGMSAQSGDDWIVEGLAEYYSLELLLRGGAITARRYQRALQKQAEWADEAETLCGDKSSGAVTALAVITFRALDKELRKRSSGKSSLDHVVARVSGSRISLQSLRDVVNDVLQNSSTTLESSNLPGCPQSGVAPEV
jgi:hypothetical protein